jgi:allantoinase
MRKTDLIIKSTRVIRNQSAAPASIHISGESIAAIRPWDEQIEGVEVLDAGDSVVMAGLVDSHVHINEPGRTDWEGFETGTKAAAAGGVTTLVDMPLNSIPPTTTPQGFTAKLEAAEGKCSVDVAFWGGVIPGNTDDLKPLKEMGVRGFKCFLLPSGVDEFPHVDERDLLIAMDELAKLDLPLLVHAELQEPIDKAAPNLKGWDGSDYRTFLESRPRESENKAIELMTRLCRATGARVHIVHHSSSDAIPVLRDARAEGLPLTVETCPHYLTLAAEEIPEGATQFKCCPPVRELENREKLWGALESGIIDMVVSDHSPCVPALKLMESGDFMAAWGGISTLQFSLPVLWTQMRGRGLTVDRLSEWMSAAPAALAGLKGKKGTLDVGCDADIVIWNPDSEFKIHSDSIIFRNKITPYVGTHLAGTVEATFLRGNKIFEHGEFFGRPQGKFLIN